VKILLVLFVFLLPFHALIITFFKCKLGVANMDFFRFWKEWIIIFLLFVSSFLVLKRNKYSFKKIYKNNYVLGLITIFIFFSLSYTYLPFFEFKTSWFLWFKYDVFFLLTLIIWLFLPTVKENFNLLLKTLFISTWLLLTIFLPWYMFWDISTISGLLWYSDKVSTYEANSCISFAQNVSGQNRFQATFGWPIRFSVFLVTMFSLYIWYILTYVKTMRYRLLLIIIPSIFVFLSVFFSYSKTSILWLLFSLTLFTYLYHKIILNKQITKKIILFSSILLITPILLLATFKSTLFLHLWSVINRADNIKQSVEMFLYNPIGYGLWIAGPASQIWKSIESAGDWRIATSTVTQTHTFLPENWFIQILLEQWVIWLALFVSLLIVIWINLYIISKRKKDFLSIAIFTSFMTLIFMANFTHAFEESATSYILFLLIWAHLLNNKNLSK